MMDATKHDVLYHLKRVKSRVRQGYKLMKNALQLLKSER